MDFGATVAAPDPWFPVDDRVVQDHRTLNLRPHGASGALLVPVPGCGVEASHVDFALVVARKAKSPVSAMPDVPKAELNGRGFDPSTFLDNFNHKNRPFIGSPRLPFAVIPRKVPVWPALPPEFVAW
jgi:hypothetical protein